MPEIDQQNRDRIKAGIGVAVFHALLGYALITGLGFEVARTVSQELKLFDVTEDPPPPPAEPLKVIPPVEAKVVKARAEKPEGAASPKNLKDTPTPVVVPPPVVELVVPTPIVAAPVAGEGNRPSAGASDVPGPGTGSGGQGNGLGSGLEGTGTGGGGGGGIRTRARHIRGGIDGSDYPRGALQRGAEGVVYLRFVVETDGRVRGCRVTRSSGSPDLDARTCALIERRFRYRPARDPSGRPVPETIIGEHVWELDQRPPRWTEEEDYPEE